MEWLERFLADHRGAAIIVSHDWTFLNATVSRILELDEKMHRVAEYAGNYSDYVAAKARERERQFAQWQDQQDEIAQLRAVARHLRGLAKMRRGGKADTNDGFARGFFANRGLETMRRAKRIEKRIEHRLTDERVEKPLPAWQMKLEFGARSVPRGGQIVVALDDVGVALSEQWLFRHANLTLQHGERIALVGPNGSGKTTLLRLIAGEIPPTEGSVRIGSNVRIGYVPQEQETLGVDANATPLEIIRHLDIPSRARFQSALEAFPGTVLIAVHDRAFIDHFATGIWVPRAGMVRYYIDREEI